MVNIAGLLGECARLLDEISDIILLNKVYWISMANPDKYDYKMAVVYIFLAIMSAYLIQTSTQINLIIYKGTFEPKNFQ